eukprot:COSAG01_NODE_75107_length_198_cov_40.696970_1_plen_41_part_10
MDTRGGGGGGGGLHLESSNLAEGVRHGIDLMTQDAAHAYSG